MASSPQIDFCTLGMYIIDEIHPSPNTSHQTPPLFNIPGGAGLFSALGARLHSPPPILSPTIGWIVDMGPDFPLSHRSMIESWSTSAVLRQREGATTRGWNGYDESEVRGFRYLNEKKRLTSRDLLEGGLGASRSFHLICSASRCVEEVEGILGLRKGNGNKWGGGDDERPLIIWEPVPDLCTAAELPRTLSASKAVDVISPNHSELAGLFGTSHDGATSGGGVDCRMVEEQAGRMLEAGIGRDGGGAIVVRCGAAGCFILSNKVRRWLPAYHTEKSKVVDPTGGGNGFLGGLAVGMVRTGGDLVEAARWGSVAASFCIEQVGVAELSTGEGEGMERWNGVSVLERLDEFRRRTI